MTPLRRKMIQDMQLRDLAAKTQEAYVHAVRSLTKFHGCSPGLLAQEQVRTYFLHLINERKLSRSTVRQQLCGIKLFYEVTLGREWLLFDLIKPKRGRKLPAVLSHGEVQALLGAVRSRKHRTGLRSSRLGPVLAARHYGLCSTPRRVALLGSPQVRARWLPLRFASFPPEGRPVSASPRLRSWLWVVVGTCCHGRSSYRGLAPHPQRAHAGRTPVADERVVRNAGAAFRLAAPPGSPGWSGRPARPVPAVPRSPPALDGGVNRATDRPPRGRSVVGVPRAPHIKRIERTGPSGVGTPAGRHAHPQRVTHPR